MALPAKRCTVLPSVDTIFVWDFDWTIVNCNSDEYVPSTFLGEAATSRRLRQMIERLGPEQWHACVSSLVNACIEECDCSNQDIVEAAASMPFLGDVRQSLQDVAHCARTGQAIVSDGNDVFIGAFLKQNGMEHFFTHGIETNTGDWKGDIDAESNATQRGGKFGVVHQSAKYGGHSCTSCPPNLCKSQVLALDILSRIAPSSDEKTPNRPRIVYVGDGSNDACPALRVLEGGDILLARDGRRIGNPNSKTGQQDDSSDLVGSSFPILSTLKRAEVKEGLIPKCNVHAWNSGKELRSLVRSILNDT